MERPRKAAAGPWQASLDDRVEGLMAAQPAYGDNSLGRMAKTVVVNKIKGLTAGRAGTPYIGVDGPPFRAVFFPEYAPLPFENEVTRYLNQAVSFFEDWAVSLVCQTMANVTSDLKPQLLSDKINADVTSRNQAVAGLPTVQWYGYVAAHAAGSITSALSALSAAEYAAALNLYIQKITAPQWVQFKQAEYISGVWQHPDWELFHHYVKLLILGATPAAVDDVIATQQSEGLTVPPNVAVGVWSFYAPWGATIGYLDVRNEAAPGILDEVCFVYPGARERSCMKEGNAYDYTAESQPGNRYRQAPSSSCFRAGSMVVTADGSLKAIEQIRPGEYVATPAGPKQVVQVATPLLLKRSLYRFAAGSFAFTDTHPFVTYDGTQGVQPGVVCVAPLKTMELVPTISRLGLTAFNKPWTPPLARYSAEKIVAVAAPTTIDAGQGSETEVLYDLVLDVAQDGLSQYFVGDQHFQYLVSTEIPRIGDAPEMTAAFVLMLQLAQPSMLDALKDVPELNVTDLLSAGLSGIAEKLLPHVIGEIQSQVSEPAAKPITAPQVWSLVNRSLALFTTTSADGKPVYDRRTDALYSMLAYQLGIPFYVACRLGWRQFPTLMAEQATLLAVTVNAIELDGSNGMQGGETFTLAVVLRRGGACFTQTLPSWVNSRQTSYYHTFEQVIYFSDWRLAPPDEEPWRIAFQLCDTETSTVVSDVAETELPGTLALGYAFQQALVYDRIGQTVGRCTFDLRPLDAASLAAEKAARPVWTPQKAAGFAQQLGQRGGQFIAEYFPKYLALFGVTTTAQSKGLIPKVEPPQATIT